MRLLLGGSRCDSLEPGARLEPLEDLARLGEERLCLLGAALLGKPFAVLELRQGKKGPEAGNAAELPR